MSSITSTVDVEVSQFVPNGLELIGTDGFDNLKGSKKRDLIKGLGESDLLYGGKKSDLIDGGTGDDFIEGGKGKDILIGGEDDDIIFGNKGKDIIDGGAGNDTIIGGVGDDIVIGSSGQDLIFGNSGNDIFEFDIRDFDDGSISIIGDFDLRKDSLVIKGVSNDDEIFFNDEDSFVYFNEVRAIGLSGVGDLDLEDVDLELF